VTHEDIVYDRRKRLIQCAATAGNGAEACRVLGVSRKTYCEWLGRVERYGLSALLRRERRAPHQPNAMSSEEVAVILAEAVTRPTLDPRSMLRHLQARRVDRSRSCNSPGPGVPEEPGSGPRGLRHAGGGDSGPSHPVSESGTCQRGVHPLGLTLGASRSQHLKAGPLS
jgi:hypothetical protein